MQRQFYNTSFKPASGPTFAIAYSGIGLNYTAMTYRHDTNQAYNANAVGLSVSFTIPGK